MSYELSEECLRPMLQPVCGIEMSTVKVKLAITENIRL